MKKTTRKTYIDCSEEEKINLLSISKNIEKYFKIGIFNYTELKYLERLMIDEYSQKKDIEYLLSLKDWRNYFFSKDSSFQQLKKTQGHFYYDNFEKIVKNFLQIRKNIPENDLENILYLLNSTIEGYSYYCWKKKNFEIGKKYFSLLLLVIDKGEKVLKSHEQLIKIFLNSLFKNMVKYSFQYSRNEKIILWMKEKWDDTILNIFNENYYLMNFLSNMNKDHKKKLLLDILKNSKEQTPYQTFENILNIMMNHDDFENINMMLEEKEMIYKIFHVMPIKIKWMILEKSIVENNTKEVELFYNKELFLKLKEKTNKSIKEKIDFYMNILDNKNNLNTQLKDIQKNQIKKIKI